LYLLAGLGLLDILIFQEVDVKEQAKSECKSRYKDGYDAD